MMLSATTIRSNQDGAVLVLFAMIAFALMGVAAICVDMGLVILTRVEMQTAVDAAAVEGLLARDANRGLPWEFQEEARRTRVNRIAALMFDEDGIPVGEDVEGDLREFGAGPVFDLSGGIGPANASQKIGENSYLYKPSLELNLENETYGDMVRGEYVGDSRLRSIEDSRYNRNDFLPVSLPPDELPGGPMGNSFLVRMRRTNDPYGLDNVPGISSAGPAIPFLFGRGTVMRVNAPGGIGGGGGYDPRRDGLTVRATAIAHARPVLTIGYPVTLDMPTHRRESLGVTPFVLWNQFWKKYEQALTAGLPLLINANGKIKVIDTPADPGPISGADPVLSGGVKGIVDRGHRHLDTPEKTDYPDKNQRRIAGFFPPGAVPIAVGDPLFRASMRIERNGPFRFFGIAPIVKKYGGAPGFTKEEIDYVRVIAFVLVELTGDKIPGPVTIRRWPSIIVPENASAMFAEGLDGLRKKQVAGIMAAHDKVKDKILAPVLVR